MSSKAEFFIGTQPSLGSGLDPVPWTGLGLAHRLLKTSPRNRIELSFIVDQGQA